MKPKIHLTKSDLRHIRSLSKYPLAFPSYTKPAPFNPTLNKEARFATLICPFIGRDFLITEDSNEVIGASLLSELVEFDNTVLSAATLGIIHGKFVLRVDDSALVELMLQDIALIQHENDGETQIYNPYEGSSNSALYKCAVHITTALLYHLNAPNIYLHGVDAPHDINTDLENILSPVQLFEQCQTILMNQLWLCTKSHSDMKEFGEKVYQRQLDSWLWTSRIYTYHLN